MGTHIFECKVFVRDYIESYKVSEIFCNFFFEYRNPPTACINYDGKGQELLTVSSKRPIEAKTREEFLKLLDENGIKVLYYSYNPDPPILL